MAIPRAIGGKAVTGAAPLPVSSGVHTGKEARERALREAEETRVAREARALGNDFIAYNNARFRLADISKPQKERDKSILRTAADVIILDKSWDDLYYIYEHQIYDEAAKTVNHYLCAHETQNCPVCPTQRGYGGQPMERGSYMMHMSVLDITPETVYDGTEFDHRKRPLALTNQLHAEFIKLMGEAMETHGTIRGMMILMERDGSFNSNVGRPVVRPDGAMYVMVSEEDLMLDFGHEEEKSEDGALIKPANFDIIPYDYGSIFPKLDRAYVQKLQEKFGTPQGGVPPAGSGRDWQRDGGQATAPTPPRVRSRSSYAPSAAPAAPAEAVEEAQEDDGTLPEVATPTPPASVPRVRTRGATATPTAPLPPPTGEPVAPSATTRTRVRPIGTAAAPVAGTSTVKRAATGVDKDIPWNE